MSHYALSAVRLDASGHRVTHVLWERLNSPYPMHYYPTEATVLEVVNALNRGDHVHFIKMKRPEEHNVKPEFRFVHEHGFHVVVYPDGAEGIAIDGFALTDLPTF